MREKGRNEGTFQREEKIERTKHTERQTNTLSRSGGQRTKVTSKIKRDTDRQRERGEQRQRKGQTTDVQIGPERERMRMKE